MQKQQPRTSSGDGASGQSRRSAKPGGRRLLHQTLAESSEDSSEWELATAVARRSPEKILKIEKSWCRIGKRILFAMAVANQNKVLKRWEQLGAALDQAPLAQYHSAKTAHTSIRKPRRDDMCYVGQPIPRTKSLRTFPQEASRCPHEGMLIATGGRSGNQPTFYWMCQGCGSRWLRVSKEQATDGKDAGSSSGQWIRKAPIQPKAAAAPPSCAGSSATRSSRLHPEVELIPVPLTPAAWTEPMSEEDPVDPWPGVRKDMS